MKKKQKPAAKRTGVNVEKFGDTDLSFMTIDTGEKPAAKRAAPRRPKKK